MTTKLERAIGDAAHFLETLQREKDRLALELTTVADPVERGFLSARLELIDQMILNAQGDLGEAKRLQFSAAFSVSRRDVRRMLKVSLDRYRTTKRTA